MIPLKMEQAAVLDIAGVLSEILGLPPGRPLIPTPPILDQMYAADLWDGTPIGPHVAVRLRSHDDWLAHARWRSQATFRYARADERDTEWTKLWCRRPPAAHAVRWDVYGFLTRDGRLGPWHLLDLDVVLPWADEVTRTGGAGAILMRNASDGNIFMVLDLHRMPPGAVVAEGGTMW